MVGKNKTDQGDIFTNLGSIFSTNGGCNGDIKLE